MKLYLWLTLIQWITPWERERGIIIHPLLFFVLLFEGATTESKVKIHKSLPLLFSIFIRNMNLFFFLCNFKYHWSRPAERFLAENTKNYHCLHTVLCKYLSMMKVTALVPFQSVTPSHVGWPTNWDLARVYSTSSVTKRANGHWHAIIASSCRWSQREYKRQPVHRINHPFASEPSSGASLLLFLSLQVRSLSECGRYGTAVVVAVSRENNGPWRQSHQECAVASSPAYFSTKEQISLLTRVIASL